MNKFMATVQRINSNDELEEVHIQGFNETGVADKLFIFMWEDGTMKMMPLESIEEVNIMPMRGPEGLNG